MHNGYMLAILESDMEQCQLLLKLVNATLSQKDTFSYQVHYMGVVLGMYKVQALPHPKCIIPLEVWAFWPLLPKYLFVPHKV